MKLLLMTLPIIFLQMAGCAGVDSSDLASERRTTNVPHKKESSGAVVGEFSADAKGEQVLVASPESAIADTAVIVSQGALSIDTEITLQEGKDLGTALPPALGIDSTVAVVMGAQPVYFGDSQGANVVGSLSLEIPVPLGNDAAASQFALQSGGSGKVGVLYIYTTETNTFKVGFEVLTQADLVGSFVRVTAKGFGWYRLVFLSSEVDSVEADSPDEPAPAG